MTNDVKKPGWFGGTWPNALKWLGGGTGAAIGYYALRACEQHPGCIMQIVGWGPLFVLMFLGFIIADRRIKDGIAVLSENAAAQQRLSSAVETIAGKDDVRAREQQLVLDELADNSKRMREQLDRVEGLLAKHLGAESHE